MELLLQSLVRRDCGRDSGLRAARELRRWLLAEEPEQIGRTLEIAAGGRGGIGEQTHGETDHDRIDARSGERDPRRDPQDGVQRSDVDPQLPDDDDQSEDRQPLSECRHVDGRRVDGRDHDERDHIVDDRECEHERAQTEGASAAHECEQAECECGVGRHRRAPAVHRRAAGIEREEDRNGHDHPADASGERDLDTPPVTQLAQVELAPSLETDHEEEQRHQPRVHPVPQVVRGAAVADTDRKCRLLPYVDVRLHVDVRPDERRDDAGKQHSGTARLGAQKRPERRIEVPNPRRATRKRACLGRRRVGGGGGHRYLRDRGRACPRGSTGSRGPSGAA
jgi:hypothetical protein